MLALPDGAHVSPGIYRIGRHCYNIVTGVQKSKRVKELLTCGNFRDQYVSLQIIASSLRELIPKIQNELLYSCIVDCHKIFQGLIFYQLL